MTTSIAHLGETPPHLKVPDESETQDLVKAAQATVNLEEPPPLDPKQLEKYSFQFNWTDDNGKPWTGSFVNRIQTLHDRQTIGVLRSRFSGAVAYDSLDPVTSEINLMVSHLMVTLEEFPDWAKNLRQLTNLELIQELYEEVASHEAIFHGREKPKAARTT